jgi:hypothetical protein
MAQPTVISITQKLIFAVWAATIRRWSAILTVTHPLQRRNRYRSGCDEFRVFGKCSVPGFGDVKVDHV